MNDLKHVGYQNFKSNIPTEFQSCIKNSDTLQSSGNNSPTMVCKLLILSPFKKSKIKKRH